MNEKKRNKNCYCYSRDSYDGTNYLFYIKLVRSMLLMKEEICKRNVNLWCVGIAILIYIINKYILVNCLSGWVGYFCHCHLNDLVCPLFFLGFSQLMLIWAGCEVKSYRYCMMIGLIGGIIWEYVAPLINPKAVSDLIDMLCYLVGTTVYYLIMKYCE